MQFKVIFHWSKVKYLCSLTTENTCFNCIMIQGKEKRTPYKSPSALTCDCWEEDIGQDAVCAFWYLSGSHVLPAEHWEQDEPCAIPSTEQSQQLRTAITQHSFGRCLLFFSNSVYSYPGRCFCCVIQLTMDIMHFVSRCWVLHFLRVATICLWLGVWLFFK